MTIFLDIVKKFLDEALKYISENSVNADRDLTNSVRKFLCLGRNEVLSREKREAIYNCLVNLTVMPSGENDEKNKKDIKALLVKARANCLIALEKHKYKPSETEKELVNAAIFLKNCYQLFAANNLIDIPRDNSPLNIARYHLAYYLVLKICEENHSGPLTKLLNNPKVTDTVLVAQKKKELVINALNTWENEIAKLDSNHKEYEETVREKVISLLEILVHKNLNICDNHTTTVRIPVDVSVVRVKVPVPTTGPSPGDLEDCLMKAIEEINRSPLMLTDEPLSAQLTA